MKILIADDNKESLYFLETLLRGSGYEVVKTINGVEALEKARKERFDMIISDILMPKMDGFQLCRECKKDDRLRKIPFVFYTATYTDEKDEKFALGLGAEKFIVKPMEPDTFVKILKDVIKDYEKEKPAVSIEPMKEKIYLKEYDERLIKKLEDKMLELENVNKRLVQSGEQIRSAYEKLKQLQSQLIQSERLAVLGELSAGIAHEINNPLNIISVHTQILSMEENLDPEVKETLKIIKKQVDQASKIADKLLQFAKSTKPEMAVVDVNELIENVLALLEHPLTLDNIKIARQLSPKLPSISADSSQLQQVFLNLITDAHHAMPKGGTLTISTEVKTPNIEIRFTDTGTGIPKENLGKLFEPFFTTREKGAGLGLSVVHGIIEAHNGNIKVESEVGKGTTFTITLPIKKQS